MMYKFVASLTILLVVRAVEYHTHPLVKTYVAPTLYKAPIAIKHIEYEDGPAEYDFSYAVHDTHTGDIKSQKESRKGDRVEGSYELIDSDGHRRLVQYTADDHNGFQAIVHREPTDIKIPIPEQVKILAPVHKVIAAAPVLHYTHAKLIAPAPKYVAPIAKVVTAPVTKIITEGHNHVSYSAPAVSYHY